MSRDLDSRLKELQKSINVIAVTVLAVVFLISVDKIWGSLQATGLPNWIAFPAAMFISWGGIMIIVRFVERESN
jgi:uncharacterized membrane protein YbhN (UPF0104 family)